jgi:hypothetical protein
MAAWALHQVLAVAVEVGIAGVAAGHVVAVGAFPVVVVVVVVVAADKL